jgi:hypoxanthine phosphoribosyltransferase
LKPESVKVATLLFKPQSYLKNLKIDYVGMEIPEDFLIGYGLDYKGYGRNFEDIYSLIK